MNVLFSKRKKAARARYGINLCQLSRIFIYHSSGRAFSGKRNEHTHIALPRETILRFRLFFSLHSRIVQFLRFTRSAGLGHIFVWEDLKNIRGTSWKCSKFKSEL